MTLKCFICRIAYPSTWLRTRFVLRIAHFLRDTQYARRIADNQLILWRIFQRARLFLLPTLRLRLGFAIQFSTNYQNLYRKELSRPANVCYHESIVKQKNKNSDLGADVSGSAEPQMPRAWCPAIQIEVRI